MYSVIVARPCLWRVSVEGRELGCSGSPETAWLMREDGARSGRISAPVANYPKAADRRLAPGRCPVNACYRNHQPGVTRFTRGTLFDPKWSAETHARTLTHHLGMPAFLFKNAPGLKITQSSAYGEIVARPRRANETA